MPSFASLLSIAILFTAQSANALQVDFIHLVKKETLMGMGESKQISEVSVLKDFSAAELAGRKSIELNETDPATHAKSRFQGVSLTEVVNEATSKLTPEDRAHIDLVILESRSGRLAYMPKAFLVKYPTIALALKKDGKDLGSAAPHVILPTTSNSKIQKESLILEPLFVSSLKSVTLTSYEDRFGSFILKRRTDPAAMRGEKYFLQNCAGCHSQGPGAGSLAMSDRLLKVMTSGHPEVAEVGPIPTRLEKKDLRSLTSYLDAFKVQASQ